MEVIFWISLAVLLYAYFGYPLLLLILGWFRPDRRLDGDHGEPTVTMIIPVHNEARAIEKKLSNALGLDYPSDKLEIIVVSDASNDRTDSIVRGIQDPRVRLEVLPERRGKGAALNRGLKTAGNEVIVFSDASILLDRSALAAVVRPFTSRDIGCVSGEDFIPGGGGEGLYGRYELLLRNLESRVSSIVGASGCFYAQRSGLCIPFLEGMAPDFLSVLATVDQGYRAVTEPDAFGEMRSVKAPAGEFKRKVRTMLRGITTLAHFRRMLNPFRYGFFAVELFSHKVLRWSSGVLLLAVVGASLALWNAAPLYRWLTVLQAAFYLLATVGWIGPRGVADRLPFRVPFFFCLVNAAALVAAGKYVAGQRTEVWEPSRRDLDDGGQS